MAKQMLFYGAIAPLSVERHRDWSISERDDYRYAAGTNACPLMVSEFRAASSSLPIIFSSGAELPTPSAVLGLEQDRNLLVAEDGSWTGRYLPAFIRRYPFVFGADPESEPDRMLLCIDEDFPGFDRTGTRGEKLFDDEGQPTETTKQALEFTRSYEVELRRTRAFAELLRDHDLLEPMNAEITMPGGQKRSLTGFSAVSRERLKGLGPEAVSRLFETDALELIYLHLASLSHMEAMANRRA